MAGVSKTVAPQGDAVDDVVKAPVKAVPKRVLALPFSGGTTIIIRDIDFAKGNVEHPTVTWDYRVKDFTVEVGNEITEEAANYLVKNFPDSFKFVQG